MARVKAAQDAISEAMRFEQYLTDDQVSELLCEKGMPTTPLGARKVAVMFGYRVDGRFIYIPERSGS